METTFKISKAKEYIVIEYVTGLKVPMSTWTNFLASTAKDARKTIKWIRDMEDGVKKNLAENGIKLDYKLIILKYLTAIDSIASGIDIRSKMSVEELSDRFVYGYKQKYDQAVKTVEETFEFFNKAKHNESYNTHWMRYEKYNDLVAEYQLDFPKIGIDDFGKDELKEIARLSKEMLDTLIKYNKENDTNENTSNTSN